MTQTARWARADKKKPITPTGRPASSTDNSTWSRYRDVQQGAGDGYGVMLGGGLGCYDLDHCIDDGVVASWAVEFIGEIPEEIVFMERSVSGTGIHVFVEADETPGYRRGKVERYSRGRFIRVTGVRLEV
ncbi:hypothetical protein [Corynebacterium auriscanis]|uniref:DNA primase/polymerase bifunctional N-terminal domain-containing protein n=1 Tax=Corynebacterium auriscanis TaxID=99807 RepID=A0A0A2DJQ8_9CORY|nr:hypothetical protein [Corynebacterium auriscanis]KGM18154.1 hypothetical protein MA47_09745 [Corynebacterium auriscanis]WJY73235.1 hypothetical protein CAURIC_08110 [Corynebacterium auriscanis]